MKFDTKAIAYIAKEAARDRDFYIRDQEGVTVMRKIDRDEVYVVVEQRPRREVATITPHELAWLDKSALVNAVMNKIDQAAAVLRGKALLDYLNGADAVEFGQIDEDTAAKMERASIRIMQLVDEARRK